MVPSSSLSGQQQRRPRRRPLLHAGPLSFGGQTFPPQPQNLLLVSSSRSTTTTTSTRLAATASSTISIDGGSFSFDDLSKLDERLAALEGEAANGGSTAGSSSSGGGGSGGFLMDYYDPTLVSFSISPAAAATNFSITSTAYAVRALLEYNDDDKSPGSTWPFTKTEMINAVLHSNWREHDLYQVSLILLAVFRLDPSLESIQDGSSKERLAMLISLALSARPQRRRGERQPFSAYIQYLCAGVYADLMRLQRNGGGGDGTVLDGLLLPGSAETKTSKRQVIVLAVARSAELAQVELCRQLAYRAAGDRALFDVIKLVYSLLTYLKATDALQGTTTTSLAGDDNSGREMVELDVTYDDVVEQQYGLIPPVSDERQELRVNPRLVNAAIQAFFEEQDDDGLWDRGQPIYKSFRRQGRNIGNAYVFGVDALGSLLELMPPETFRPYLANLELTLQWMEQNQKVEVVPDYCDPLTGKCYGKVLRGWASSHLLSAPPPGNGPKAWSTAQSITCLARMRRVVRALLHRDVLDEFRGRSLSKKGPSDVAWDRLLDSDLGSPLMEDGCLTIKCVLESRIVEPFAKSVSTPSVGAAYSTILFGSPGTAKTTITEAVAEKLGWDFLVIDTAVFLEDGLTNVASRIQYVFRRLQALRECVILFDEIEEFCLDRETAGITMESRMLTTAMLTAINDLRRTKQSIFFLATNRLRAFDAAIIRPGRFDMQLFVGTPNLNARIILLRQALVSSGAGAPDEDIIKVYTEFLKSVWTQDAMFFNYLEAKQFATSVAAIVASGRMLEQDELDRILSKQATVMTARGSVREEYMAQMELSRL